jgi:hypothetical protein
LHGYIEKHIAAIATLTPECDDVAVLPTHTPEGIALFIKLLRKLLARLRSTANSEHQTDFRELGQFSDGLGAEYKRLVAGQLQRLGVPEKCASIEVRLTGRRAQREVYIAVVRFVQWDRTAAVRLLLGLPLLDMKVRKAVRGLWLADVSVFDGVLLQASEEVQQPAATAELRELVVSLTGARSRDAARDASALQSSLFPVRHH